MIGVVLALLVVVLVLGGCFGDDPSPNGEAAVPRFVPAGESLARLVDTTFTAATLPEALGGAGTGAIAGAEIIGGSAGDPDGTVALHWSASGGTASFAFSELVDPDAAEPTWRIRSVWQLLLGPDMVLTVGTNVCKPDPQSYDPNLSRFVAVTNVDQDQAFDAWVLYETGPTPYGEPLDCERFVP